VRIFNNTVIDSQSNNFCINSYAAVEILAGYIYNNASILYDETGDKHVEDYGADMSNWTIDNNSFWDAL